MKAVTYTEFGPPEVLQLSEVPKPVPKDDEVLIGVRAAAINPLDWRFMRGEPAILRLFLGLRKPKRVGRDLAGAVEAVGARVTQFKPGDPVFGFCAGALAEYACARASAVARKPESVAFEQAASVYTLSLHDALPNRKSVV